MKTTEELEKELNKYIGEHNPDLILMHPKTLKRLWLSNVYNNFVCSINDSTRRGELKEEGWKEFKNKPRYTGKRIITSKDMKKDEFIYFIKQDLKETEMASRMKCSRCGAKEIIYE
jgi:hypothetical protein